MPSDEGDTPRPRAPAPRFTAAETAEQFFRLHLPHHGARRQVRRARVGAGDRRGARRDGGAAARLHAGRRGHRRVHEGQAARASTWRRSWRMLRARCAGRPDLVRIFIEIQVRAALAGNNLDGPVRKYVNRVATNLGMSEFELAQIEAVLRIQRGNFRREHAAPPNSRSAARLRVQGARSRRRPRANEEVVKAYRRAAEPPSSRQAQSQWPARVDDRACEGAHAADHRSL